MVKTKSKPNATQASDTPPPEATEPPATTEEEFLARLAAAKGVRSQPGRTVKLGRARTRIAGSRAFLRLLAGTPRPKTVTMKQIHGADEDLRILTTWKSIGDALCGNPEQASSKARGLGMARQPGIRELLCDQDNARLAIRCLREEGEMEWEAIAALVGAPDLPSLIAWVDSLPARANILAAEGQSAERAG
jgi:hypothetical protein